MPLWYNLLWGFAALLGSPFILILLIRYGRRGTVWRRLGLPGSPSPAGPYGHPPIWIHALSVGEVTSAEPIVHELRRLLPDHPLVFSTATRTGMQTARRLFGRNVQTFFYSPYDLLFQVRPTVRRISPYAVIVVETDIWPNFLFYLKRQRVPVLWVNARLSNRTFRGYRLLGTFSRRVLNTFSAIGVQSEADAGRLDRLGVVQTKVFVTGNIKCDQTSSVTARNDESMLRAAMGIDAHRRVIVLGSTHPGEEAMGLEVFGRLREQFCNTMLIIAPRDPGRSEAIIRQARSSGWSATPLAAFSNNPAHGGCDILVVSTIGLLRRLYAVADIAFVGGSMVSEGGHNPLEPAAYGKPIVFGPDMSDFNTIAAQLVGAGGAVQVPNKDHWYRVSAQLIADPGLRARMGRRALMVLESNRGAVANTLGMIVRIVSQQRKRRGCSDEKH